MARRSYQRNMALAFAALAGVLAGTYAGTARTQEAEIAGAPLQRSLVIPGVRAVATYSDNILLVPDGQEEGDFIVEVSPHVSIKGSSPRTQYDLYYEMRNFRRVDDGESNFFRHLLNARGNFVLIPGHAGIDATGFMGYVNDATQDGPLAFDPAAAFVDSSKIRQFSLSPWLRNRLADLATYEVRYTLARTESDASMALADADHHVTASVDGLGAESSAWNWRWYGEAQRRDYDDIALERRMTGVAVYYRTSPSLRVFGSIEYEQIDEVRDEDGNDSGYGPGLGFEWAPNARTRVSASVSERYYGTVGNAGGAYTTDRSTIGVRYLRDVQTSASSALLFLDPAQLTAGTSGVPNPVLDNLIVGGIDAPGGGGALSQGLVTDTAMLEDRLTAFYGLYSPRNSLTFSVFTSKRKTPSGFSGTTGIGNVFMGELRERGAALLYRRRLDPLAVIDVGLHYRRTASSTIDDIRHATTFRAGYLRHLTRYTDFLVGARHTRQRSSDSGAEYDENAIYIGIDARFR